VGVAPDVDHPSHVLPPASGRCIGLAPERPPLEGSVFYEVEVAADEQVCASDDCCRLFR